MRKRRVFSRKFAGTTVRSSFISAPITYLMVRNANPTSEAISQIRLASTVNRSGQGSNWFCKRKIDPPRAQRAADWINQLGRPAPSIYGLPRLPRLMLKELAGFAGFGDI